MPTSLAQAVDQWTTQAMVASGYLVRLYRSLRDGRQAAVAMQARGPCEERAQRLGLHAQIQSLNLVFVADHPGEAEGEEKAWEMLIEAHAGLSTFYSLIEDHDQGRNLRGWKTATAKAFHQSLKGYRTAFPEVMTTLGIHRAIEYAACTCIEMFLLAAECVTDQEKEDLRQELRTSILEALRSAVENTSE